MSESVFAIIAAGGRGTRLGASVPKQLLEIGGKSILERSVTAIAACPRVDGLVLVVPPDYAGTPADWRLAKPLQIVTGGPRRQDSVANGFAAVPVSAGVVVVHDAARPFVTASLVEQTVDAALVHGAAVAALRARDTVKLTAGAHDRTVAQTVSRDRVWLAQTPQAFRWDVLRDAVGLGQRGVEATDEAALAEQVGHRVHLVEGDPRNIKITTNEDLEWAVQSVGDAGTARIGFGYDSHRLVEGRPLILGGVRIPFDRGLLGHSDADIVCHAVTDAVLGAAAAGDIGGLFPDTDAAWKDASSLDLLARAMARVRQSGYRVVNVDVVVIAERPKLAPHTLAMRESLAAVLDIGVDAVSVKGKTNEGLDAVGRGEAMVAQAVALLIMDRL